MLISTILKDARKLIDTPEKHTTHVYARDMYDNILPSDSPLACKFCSLGALRQSSNLTYFVQTIHFLYKVLRELNTKLVDAPIYIKTRTLADFNDSKSHEDIMKLWDRAIVLAEEHEEENEIK